MLQEIDAGRRWLKDDLWFELDDDAKVLSVVFDSPYMMLINQKEYPIRLYDGETETTVALSGDDKLADLKRPSFLDGFVISPDSRFHTFWTVKMLILIKFKLN